MNNPYLDLGRTPEEVAGEEIEGTFFCQTHDCYEVEQEARYLSKETLITWICKAGHISKVKRDLG